MRDDDDGFGQVDGDAAPAASPFATGFGQQPWLRSGTPPWHMWGNSQSFDLRLASGANTDASRGQLVKVSYGRPETWHWIFAAKLISGTAAPVGSLLQLSIVWELTVGIGRSVFQHPAFDAFRFHWEAANAPAGGILMATQAIKSAFSQNVAVPLPADDRPVVEIVAQDIQLNARLALAIGGAQVGYPYDVTVELSAFFSPKTHMRPDWFREAPEELQFPGAEIAGR